MKYITKRILLIIKFDLNCFRIELTETLTRRRTTICVIMRTRVTEIQEDHCRHSTRARVTQIW